MRYPVILPVMMLCALMPARADGPLPKELVRFDGQTLLLAYEQGREPAEAIKEYIPEGENLESWTKLASIHYYPQSIEPKELAANMLRIMKEQNPGARGRMIQNPETGEVILDFVTWPQDMAYAEFNVFRFTKKPGGELVAQQYALREYKDPRTFLKELGPVRKRIVDLMSKDGLVFDRK